MQYTLRLFEDGAEISTSTVAYIPGAQNYPSIGQTISDLWEVTEVISASEAECCFRVKRLRKPSH
jgi:hypothetical protein